jgi:hypothetical protein
MSLLASVGGWVASVFGGEAGANTALKIVEKISGTDWTPQQKADFMINYQNATKHQSPARRFIAFAFTIGMALFGFVYLMSGVVAQAYVFIATSGDTLALVSASQNLAEIRIKPLLTLQNDSYVYMKEVLSNPMTWILGFYFAVDIGSKIKK